MLNYHAIDGIVDLLHFFYASTAHAKRAGGISSGRKVTDTSVHGHSGEMSYRWANTVSLRRKQRFWTFIDALFSPHSSEFNPYGHFELRPIVTECSTATVRFRSNHDNPPYACGNVCVAMVTNAIRRQSGQVWEGGKTY